MFIRRTSHKKKRDGDHYYTYRLVASQRVGAKVCQRAVLNLGVDFTLPKEQWPTLTRRIEEILEGQQPLFETEPSLAKLAHHYASRILLKNHEDNQDNTPDYRTVDIGSLATYRPRSIGCEHVILEALRTLELDKKFAALGFNGPQAALAIGTVVARACHPASERETHRWLRDQSGLGELINFDFERVDLHGMYTVSDQLLKHKPVIERHLYQKERNLFSLEETITLYDLTNTYFEGECRNNSLAKRGHSKEKRTDCPLVTLALVLDSSGFPKRSRVYEGNVSEPATFSEMISDLQNGSTSANTATVVMDAGIATEDNIDYLKERGIPYLVVSRKRRREFDEAQAVVVKEGPDSTVKVRKVVDPDSGEILLYCHSTQREKKERAMGRLFSTRFEDTLKYLDQGLSIKRRMKKYDKVVEKIGRLKQQYSKASKHYAVQVEKDEKTGNAKKITWHRKPAPETTDTFPGVYCMRTSQADWDEATLWTTYTMLTDLEAVFRSLKSELGLRPVYHQIATRVSGHLFICVLAYHLVHFVRLRLKHRGVHDSWTTLRNLLLPHDRVTVSMQCKDGSTVHVRKSVQPDPAQQQIYSFLDIKQHPGDTVKTTIPGKMKDVVPDSKS